MSVQCHGASMPVCYYLLSYTLLRWPRSGGLTGFQLFTLATQKRQFFTLIWQFTALQWLFGAS